jgi:hypothetical protein
MNLRRVILLATAALIGSSICAMAQANLLRRWHDNASDGDLIGTLVIEKDSVSAVVSSRIR